MRSDYLHGMISITIGTVSLVVVSAVVEQEVLASIHMLGKI